MTTFIFTNCDKDDPEPPVPEEIITTLIYTLIPFDGGVDIDLTFVDLDGDGGDAPTITGGTLAANSTYTGNFALLNESVTPSENITDEIAELDAEHQFFFESTIAGLSVAYTDSDADGNPVGLFSTLTTGEPGSGELTVTLRHEPNKSGTDVAAGDITNAGGETDIEVTFPIDVQ